MSKSKRARFHLKSYCAAGGYAHAVQGDAVLTDTRFHFYAQLTTGEIYTVEIPLSEIYGVEKIGVPFFTRSLCIATDRGNYRFNAFFGRAPQRRSIRTGNNICAARSQKTERAARLCGGE